MPAKMRISLVSWTVSTETDPRVRGTSPPETSPWCCTSWQRLHSNRLERPLWSIWPSRLFSSWPWGQANAGMTFMLGKTSDNSQTGQRCLCTQHPAFFPRTSWPRSVQTVWPKWLYQPWPQLWISQSSLIGPYAQSEHYSTIWIEPKTLDRTRS